MKDPRDVIIEPVVSEKSYGLLEENVYTFKVHPSASKPEIPSAERSGFAGLGITTIRCLIRAHFSKLNAATRPLPLERT